MKNIGRCLAGLVLGAIFAVGCLAQPLEEWTMSQAIASKYLVPLPNSASSYSQLKPHWFEKGDPGCRWLSTFFLDASGQIVAMMGEKPWCGFSSRDPDIAHPNALAWTGDDAYRCKPDLSLIPYDSSIDPIYKTCLVWSKGKMSFILYSTLSEQEIIDFANSLTPQQADDLP
jgi:hypothetical protein